MRHMIHLSNPNVRHIGQAVGALEKGGIVIYPTDTVYGMGCNVYDKKALEKLYRVKGKSPTDSMSLLCASIQQASNYVKINNFVFKILKRCLPGPYTIILEATREIPKLMLSRKKQIGIRIPNSEVCRALIEGLGNPIVNSSATEEVTMEIPDGDFSMEYVASADMLLDAGILSDAIESTVVRIIGSDIEILREGGGDPDLLFG